uniref:Uncharacterized protein n=1 Tax=Anopheles atroparvus TaxID=41427 RepID=A0AAG5DJI1_ANOAO
YCRRDDARFYFDNGWVCLNRAIRQEERLGQCFYLTRNHIAFFRDCFEIDIKEIKLGNLCLPFTTS